VVPLASALFIPQTTTDGNALDEFTVHVLIGGELVKTVQSSLTAEDLEYLWMRGAAPAGPPSARPALARTASLPGGTIIEADRNVDANGNA
jgi:hypothetical protein